MRLIGDLTLFENGIYRKNIRTIILIPFEIGAELNSVDQIHIKLNF